MPYVQFSDSTETKVIAVFACPQGSEVYPNQSLVDADDPRYITFMMPNKLPQEAQAALAESDKVAIRCAKAGVTYPSAWLTRDIALRAIANGTDTTSTTLPVIPPYPEGT